MSYEDRRYWSEEPTRRFRDDRPIGVVWLIGVTTGVAVLTWLVGGGKFGANFALIVRQLGISVDGLLDGKIWQVFTPMFLHGDFWHLLSNMLILFFVGRFLEIQMGTRWLIKTYLGLGVFASFGVFLDAALPYGSAAIPSIGASGAVMGLLAFFGTRFPDLEIRLFGIWPMRAWVLALLVVVIDFVRIFESMGYDNVSRGVHLVGAFGGFGLVKFVPAIQSRFAAKQHEMKRRHQQKEREVARRENQQLDEILDKVHQDGMDSLSERERKFLLDQSEKRKR